MSVKYRFIIFSLNSEGQAIHTVASELTGTQYEDIIDLLDEWGVPIV